MLYIVDLQATRKEAFLMKKALYDNANQKLIEREVKPVLKLNNIIKNICSYIKIGGSGNSRSRNNNKNYNEFI